MPGGGGAFELLIDLFLCSVCVQLFERPAPTTVVLAPPPPYEYTYAYGAPPLTLSGPSR